MSDLFGGVLFGGCSGSCGFFWGPPLSIVDLAKLETEGRAIHHVSFFGGIYIVVSTSLDVPPNPARVLHLFRLRTEDVDVVVVLPEGHELRRSAPKKHSDNQPAADTPCHGLVWASRLDTGFV